MLRFTDSSTVITKDIAAASRFGGFTVTPSATVFVEPGANIRFRSGAQADVFGALIAIGTPEEPINFGPFFENGYWRGLLFTNSSSTLRNVNFRHGNFADRLYNIDEGVIWAKDSQLELENVFITDTHRPHFSMQLFTSNVKITGGEIGDTVPYTGGTVWDAYSCGIKVSGGNLFLDNVNFKNMDSGVVTQYGDSVLPPTLTMVNMSPANFVSIIHPWSPYFWGSYPTSTP